MLLAQLAQLLMLQMAQVVPVGPYPGRHPVHTVAELQVAQFEITQGEHNLLALTKNPGLQVEH